VKKKYLVIGDYVTSDDGDRHYVSARELVRLYGVNIKECELFDQISPRSPRETSTGGLFVLGPLKDGKYSEYLKIFNDV
jgi:hypothetical protein